MLGRSKPLPYNASNFQFVGNPEWNFVLFYHSVKLKPREQRYKDSYQ